MRILYSVLIVCFLSAYKLYADNHNVNQIKTFTHTFKLKTTGIKNQFKSNTCWAFASMALIESELIREKNMEIDLSEMYIVRMAYLEKARRFVRMQGNTSFSNGGSLPDAFYVIQKYGILPDSVYRGIPPDLRYPDHWVIDSVLSIYMDSVVKSKSQFVNNWEIGFNTILDNQFGTVPEKFSWSGKNYTPLEFSKMLGISYSDYIYFTSLNGYPLYSESVLEFPDNWLWNQAFNLPWSELEKTVLYGLKNGYSCGLCCDISEEGYIKRDGVAEYDENIDLKKIDFLRQSEIDNFRTLDEHAMQAVGLAKDSLKKDYIIFKNSWGGKYSPYGDLVYMSFPYLRMKTTSILINKKAVPKDILSKLKRCSPKF